MLILGIDPGTATTGYGLIKIKNAREAKKESNLSRCGNLKPFIDIVDYGCLVTSPEDKTGDRLNDLFLSTSQILKTYKPKILAIERLFFFSNAKTIISVGQARGVVILAAAQNGVEVFEYAPLQIKSELVGYGRAKKKEVQRRVGEVLGVSELSLDKNKKFTDGHHIDDAADALAVALLHFSKEVDMSLKPFVDKEPKKNTKSKKKSQTKKKR